MAKKKEYSVKEYVRQAYMILELPDFFIVPMLFNIHEMYLKEEMKVEVYDLTDEFSVIITDKFYNNGSGQSKIKDEAIKKAVFNYIETVDFENIDKGNSTAYFE